MKMTANTIFITGADEILVREAPAMRANPGAGKHGGVTQFNDLMTGGAKLG